MNDTAKVVMVMTAAITVSIISAYGLISNNSKRIAKFESLTKEQAQTMLDHNKSMSQKEVEICIHKVKGTYDIVKNNNARWEELVKNCPNKISFANINALEESIAQQNYAKSIAERGNKIGSAYIDGYGTITYYETKRGIEARRCGEVIFGFYND